MRRLLTAASAATLILSMVGSALAVEPAAPDPAPIVEPGPSVGPDPSAAPSPSADPSAAPSPSADPTPASDPAPTATPVPDGSPVDGPAEATADPAATDPDLFVPDADPGSRTLAHAQRWHIGARHRRRSRRVRR